MTLRIGWFSTGSRPGSQRYQLLEAAAREARSGALDAELTFVFCNRVRGEDAGTDDFLDLVASLDIPLLTLSSREFRRARGGALSSPGEPLPPWRREYDGAVAELISGSRFDVGVLAGYMLIFTGEMCNRYPLLNLHPAAPGGPAGAWQEVIWQLIERRAERSGVMIHLSTEELDAGPVVSHCSFSLRGPGIDPLWDTRDDRPPTKPGRTAHEEDALFQEIRRRGSVREVPLVLSTIRALALGRVHVDRDQVLAPDGTTSVGGIDLTEEVDAAVGVSAGPSL